MSYVHTCRQMKPTLHCYTVRWCNLRAFTKASPTIFASVTKATRLKARFPQTTHARQLKSFICCVACATYATQRKNTQIPDTEMVICVPKLLQTDDSSSTYRRRRSQILFWTTSVGLYAAEVVKKSDGIFSTTVHFFGDLLPCKSFNSFIFFIPQGRISLYNTD